MKTNGIEWTEREKFLLSYYREPTLSGTQRRVVYDGIMIGVSVLFVWMYISTNETAWGAVAYGILIWRVSRDLFAAPKYVEDLRGIFAKYESRIEELNKTQSSATASSD